MTDVYEDRPDVTVDRGRLTAEDLDKIRFTTAVRGYRMDEVDAFVERLKAELELRSAAEPAHQEAPAADDGTQVPARPDTLSEGDYQQLVDQLFAEHDVKAADDGPSTEGSGGPLR